MTGITIKKVIKQLSIIITLLIFLFGCATVRNVNQSAVSTEDSDAITALNKQIEKFNTERTPSTMGISPIEQRVARVEYNAKLDQVTSFTESGKVLLVLKRKPDGRFKGILEVPYHQLVGSESDGSHTWGHVLAEFYLEKEMF